jgi:hypothetical protein
MHFKGTKAGIGSAIALAALMLGGCVVTARPAYVGPVVTVAPPPPQVEVIGVAPTPGYVWFGGYWDWVGGRHVWVGGHWGPGRAGYHWVGHHWVEGPHGGWHMAAGHWER